MSVTLGFGASKTSLKPGKNEGVMKGQHDVLWNVLALSMFIFHVESWKPNSIYLANLAMADLVEVICLIFRADYFIRGQHWIFGDVPCRMLLFLVSANRAAGIFFLTAVAVDRYLKIVHPLHRLNRMNLSYSVWVSAGLWAMVIVFTGQLLGSPHFFNVGNHTQCESFNICLNVSPLSIWQNAFYVIQFCVPGSIITFCTVCITWQLKTKTMDSTGKIKKAVQFIVIVAMVFLICFFPSTAIRVAIWILQIWMVLSDLLAYHPEGMPTPDYGYDHNGVNDNHEKKRADYYLKGQDWTFGDLSCRMMLFLTSANRAASIFFLTAVAVDRYLKIVHPLHRLNRMNLSYSLWVSAGLWAMVIVFQEFAFGLTGNVLALCMFAFHVESWKPNSIYLANLAMADLVVLVCVLFRADYYMRGQNWIFGDIFCRILLFLLAANRAAGIFFLTAVAVDRYLKIVHPLHRINRMNLSYALWVSAGLWALVIVFTGQLLGSPHFFNVGNHTQCESFNICLSVSPLSIWQNAFYVIQFCVPGGIIIFCTVCITWQLKTKTMDTTGKIKRAVQFIFVVAMVFLICFFPSTASRVAVWILQIWIFTEDSKCAISDPNMALNHSQHSPILIRVIPPILLMEAVCGITGNIVALVMFAFESKTWKPNSIYLANMAVADIVVLFFMPFRADYYIRGQHWIFGDVFCRMLLCFVAANRAASIFFLTAVAMDRYLKIVHPLHRLNRMDLSYAMWVSAGLWALVILCTGQLLGSPHFFSVGNHTQCESFNICLDSSPIYNWQNTFYLIQFCVPGSIIVFCTACITWQLKTKTMDTTGKIKRAVQFILIVDVAFFFCFFPSTVSRSPILIRVLPPILLMEAVCGITGNIVALVMFAFESKTWKPNSIYLANMAMADLLVLFFMPFRADYYIRGQHWIFGDVFCRILLCLVSASRAASIFFLTAVAVDRYLKIVHPLHRLNRMDLSYAMWVSTGLWALVIIFTFDLLGFPHFFNVGNHTQCESFNICLDNSPLYIWQNTFYVIQFCVPGSIIVFCTACITWQLKTKTMDTTGKIKRAVQFIYIVAVAFFFCFFPSTVSRVAIWILNIWYLECSFYRNILALIMFAFEVKTWKPNSIYLANMATADLVVLFFMPLRADYYIRGQHWIFGDALCRIMLCLVSANRAASIFFLTAVAVDQYLKIVHPLHSINKMNV
ncbi:hydroxycarboxylic acid receptor 2-like, partial [Clarias magur]